MGLWAGRTRRVVVRCPVFANHGSGGNALMMTVERGLGLARSIFLLAPSYVLRDYAPGLSYGRPDAASGFAAYFALNALVALTMPHGCCGRSKRHLRL